jgi:hypothetical protein
MPISIPSYLRLLKVLLTLFILSSVTTHARDAEENSRIDHLLQSVENLEGAVLIRNGTEYKPKDAVSHLRMKLDKVDDKIKTAENFIDGLASKSSVSGKAYQIRKSDGTAVTTSAFFYARLKEYDKANP